MKHKIQPKQTNPVQPEKNIQPQIKFEKRADTEEDFRKLPYEGKVRYDY